MTFHRLCFLALTLPILVATAENSTERSTSANGRKQDYKKPVDDLVCRPFGECEPCPEDEVSSSSSRESLMTHSSAVCRYINPTVILTATDV